MEYIRVKLSKKVDEQDIPVIIDGENNGFVNSIIEVDDGDIEVSADYPGAECKLVTVEYASTDPVSPQEIIINVV